MRPTAIAVVALILFLGFVSPGRAAATVKFCMGCNLAGAALARADFTSALYVGANFEGAQLVGATFRGARLIAANFHNADLRGVTFDGVECLACNFEGASLDGATFAGARFTTANFHGFASALGDVQLRDLLGECIACNFRDSRLGGRNLSGLALISVDFSNSDLRGATLAGTVLCWYDGTRSSDSGKCDQLRGAALAGADLQRVQICVDPLVRSGCREVPAAMLRRESGSALEDAALSP
ncbi:MAG TPA: pentapeptide repeat-containing protein [Candidatus Cybelea sp.]|jgi:uncharacterized protein YjbI with pentapeptide repeats|nr:pentapeptide repeat-containing protein [Candidatus Cybelea sp.]